MTQQNQFKWRHFQTDIILLCVRWYLGYALSYRDLEEMMLECGLSVDHTTVYRWVPRYAPELERRYRPHLKACNDSWRLCCKNEEKKWNVSGPSSLCQSYSLLLHFWYFNRVG
jgi:transposase-like protein